MRAGDFVGAKIYRKPTADKRTKKDGTPRSTTKLGKIHFPVFTPGGTRVVGFMVRQSDIAGMIERPDRFVALDAIGVYEGAVAVDDVKGTYDAAAAKRLDINLDDCIIWVGMDVRTESGDVVGYCSDVEFKPRSGIVQTFYVTASAASSTLSDTRSQTLSGCPSVTDSEVKIRFSLFISSVPFHSSGYEKSASVSHRQTHLEVHSLIFRSHRRIWHLAFAGCRVSSGRSLRHSR